MKYGHVFWDWNGTLIDDLQISIDSINYSLEERNMPLMDKKRYFDTFCFPVEEYYKKIGFDLAEDNYEILANEFIYYYNMEVKKAKLQKHASEVIAKLSMNGVKQYILSASEKEILIKGLKRFGISTFFTDIIALDNIYAHGKIGVAKAWFEKHKFNEKALMVGDTEHDFEVAKELGMDCILYAGGHTNRDKLYKIGAPVINDYLELYDYIFEGETLRKIKTKENQLSDDNQAVNEYKEFYNDVKVYSKLDHKSDW